MTNNNHPITPSPELVQQLQDAALFDGDEQQSYERRLITAAYRAGADQELEACCEWLGDDDDRATLRAARRPKPPSLKVRIAEAIAKGNKHDALSLLDEALPDD